MSCAYEGPATVGVLALYLGQPPNKLTTYELNVRILNGEHQRFRLEFDRYLQGPGPGRSRRETLRTWASLTSVGRFAESVGLSGFSVEL